MMRRTRRIRARSVVMGGGVMAASLALWGILATPVEAPTQVPDPAPLSDPALPAPWLWRRRAAEGAAENLAPELGGKEIEDAGASGASREYLAPGRVSHDPY